MILSKIASWLKKKLTKKNVSTNKVVSATTVVAVRFETGVILGSDGRLLASGYAFPIQSDCEKIIRTGLFIAVGCSGDSIFLDMLMSTLASDLANINGLTVTMVANEVTNRMMEFAVSNETDVAVIVVGRENDKWPIIKLETIKRYPYVKETRIVDDKRFAAVGSGRKPANNYLTKKKLAEYPLDTTDPERKREIVLNALKKAVEKDLGSGGRLQVVSIDEKGSNVKNYIQNGGSGCCVSEYYLDLSRP